MNDQAPIDLFFEAHSGNIEAKQKIEQMRRERKIAEFRLRQEKK